MSEEKHIGTALERQRRRQYWTIMAVALIISLVIGLAGRFSVGPEGTIAPALAVALALALTLLLIIGNWIYFRRVDELEWANNLIAGFWGFNAFMLAFPVWHILQKGRLAPEPDVFAIYMGAASIALTVYLWRKFR